MAIWKCLHLHLDENDTSKVDRDFTIEFSTVDFAPPATPMLVSPSSTAKMIAFLELPIGWHGGWHPSPNAQWVFCIGGVMGYRAGDGSEFALGAGSCILTSDTSGTGHDSWNAGAEAVRLAIVQI